MTVLCDDNLLDVLKSGGDLNTVNTNSIDATDARIAIIYSNAGGSTPEIRDYLFKLVNKAIPEKPIVEHNFYGDDYNCPTCKKSFGRLDPRGNFCYRCGQALDWSEEE